MATPQQPATVLIRVTKNDTVIHGFRHQYGAEIHVTEAMAAWLVRQRQAEILSK